VRLTTQAVSLSTIDMLVEFAAPLIQPRKPIVRGNSHFYAITAEMRASQMDVASLDCLKDWRARIRFFEFTVLNRLKVV
jgi:hypothetical protein